MFQQGVISTVVHALRQSYLSDVGFRSIDFEYPEDQMKWPALLVQFRPTTVQWTGIHPDIEYGMISNWPDENFQQIRQGRFEGSVELEILALTAAERDRLWDELVVLSLMGKMNEETRRFFDELESSDLVNMLIQDSRIEPVGNSVNMGTPWGSQELVYEASLRLNCLGEFYADVAKRQLINLSDVEVFVSDEERNLLTNEELSNWPSDDDGDGEWH